METKQLNGYKIEFYSKEEWKGFSITKQIDDTYNIAFGDNFHNAGEKYRIYAGLVSEISEELAEKFVDKEKPKTHWTNPIKPNCYYRVYNAKRAYWLLWEATAKESFQTLSNLPYCVIQQIKDK